MIKPIPNTPLLVEIARLYYDHQFSQFQIAKRLDISRPQVSRLLAQARENGIVRIQIIDPRDSGLKLENVLQQAYGLKKVIVVPNEGLYDEEVKKRLAQAAAKYLDQLIVDDLTLGVSWGTTVREVAKYLQPRPVKNVTVVQIVGGIPRSQRDTHASESALRIGENYRAVPYLLPLPAIVNNAQLKQGLVTDKNISRVLELGKNADIALFSIGVFDHDSLLVKSDYFDKDEVDNLVKSGATADVCSRIITSEGEICSPELDARTIGIELSELRKKKLAIAVAGGMRKLKAIKAALQGKFFNVLITDEIVAEALLPNNLN